MQVAFYVNRSPIVQLQKTPPASRIPRFSNEEHAHHHEHCQTDDKPGPLEHLLKYLHYDLSKPHQYSLVKAVLYLPETIIKLVDDAFRYIRYLLAFSGHEHSHSIES